jgi:hypothetical protein
MGRRSRKRAAPATPPPEPATRPGPAPVLAAQRRRARSEDRPPPPWGAFPLGEIVTFLGIVGLVVGFATGSFRVLAVAFAMVGLSALELAVREHRAGFRSHSSLLALAAGVAVAGALVALGTSHAVQVTVAAGVAAAAFIALRRAFQRRSGGLGFRA